MTWWESWFGEEYLDLYPHRDLDSARREAAFALAHLPPRPDAPAGPLLRLRDGTRFPSPRPACRRWVSTTRPRCSIWRAGATAQPAAGARRHARPPLPRRRFRRGRQLLHELRLLPPEAENVAVVAEIERVLRPAARSSATPSAATTCSRGSSPRSADAAATRSTGSAARGTPRRSASRRRSRSAARARPRSSARACAPTPPDELVALFWTARGCASRRPGADFDETPPGPDSPRLIVLARASRRSRRDPVLEVSRALASLPRLPRGFPRVLSRIRRRSTPRASAGAELLAPRAARAFPPRRSVAGETRRARMAEELAAGRAVAVVDGPPGRPLHGPAFTLMKALDAIHIARELSRARRAGRPGLLGADRRPRPAGGRAHRAADARRARRSSCSRARTGRTASPSARLPDPGRASATIVDAFRADAQRPSDADRDPRGVRAPQRAGDDLRRGLHRDAARSRGARSSARPGPAVRARCARRPSRSSSRPREKADALAGDAGARP